MSFARFTLLLLLLAGGSRSVSGGVVINEILAVNDGGLKDEDTESPGWIELYNASAASVNLSGWHLTDAPGNPLKWTFPATNLPSGGYLVIYASGKNRAVAGNALHTNFELDNDGGYLALVRADGVTVEHVLNYPNQRANVAYGVQLQGTPLIDVGAAARVYVPTNNVLGSGWNARTFADGSWYLSNSPVAFSLGTFPSPVVAIDINERGVTPVLEAGFSSYVINSNVSATAVQTQAVTRVFGGTTITISNASQYGYDDRVRGQPVNSGAFTESALLRDFIFTTDNVSTGGMDIVVSGLVPNRTHRFTIWSYDNTTTGARHSDWTANGLPAKTDYIFDGSVLPTDNSQYTFTFDTTSDGAGKVVVSGRRTLPNPGFSVFLNAMRVQMLTNQAAVTGLAGLMNNINATAYLRFPFTVADTNAFQMLRLRMKYDDGFVAYINGQQVAARNAPGAPTWNSTATGAGTNANDYEEFLIANTPGLLVNGANVLAIQGLNLSPADADFLIQPVLESITPGPGVERYFQPSTPSTANAQSYLGLVGDTKFSVNRGFFDTPFSVAITSATVTASIYWTTNGSTPSFTNGTLYTGPISIPGTRVLRAAAFLTNYVATVPDAQTYVFLDQVVQQPDLPPGYTTVWQGSYPADYGMDPNVVNSPAYGPTISNDLRSIPTLSIVTEHANLWDPTTGIYVDATQSGDFWERPASVELFNGDGSSQFQLNCALQMEGGSSRFNDRVCKHSFQLLFKAAYGPSKLNYAWFPGAVSKFDTVILRACFTDAWTTRYSDQTLVPGGKGTRYRPEDSIYLRDIWMKDTLRDMGYLQGRNNFVHLYLNGLYWGLYNPTERLDASFFTSHLGGFESDWDVIRDVSEVLDGNKNDWSAMMALCNAGITSESAYQSVQQLIDLNNLIDYMLLHIFAEAEDWPSHNWYAAHRRANPTNGLPATKWIFLSWDQEIVLDQLVTNERVNVNNNDTPARIYSQLRNWPEFRREFGDHIQKYFFNGGALTPSNNAARLQARAAQIDRAIVGESARWGDAREFTIGSNPGHGQTFNRDDWWVPELQKLYTNCFPGLIGKNLARFRGAGLYPSIDAPIFNQFGGNVPAGFTLAITNPNPSGVIYFTLDGSDPRTYGTGAVAPTAQAYSTPVLLNQPVVVRARIFNGSEWSALVETSFAPPQDLTKLALTEIMYNPPIFGAIPGNDLEFIELKNVGPEPLNLSGLTFSGITFTFTNGTLLAPGQFFVLARNASAFATRYPGVPFRGVFTGQLDNSGEALTLSLAGGGNVFSITYDDIGPWPATPDGYGFSLVPKQPGVSQAPDDGNKWRASTLVGGSPGADDPAPNLAPIVINEVLAHTDLPDRDTIELYNPTGTNVNISGWYLTDDIGTPQKFRIPNGTVIPPLGYVYFDDAAFGAGTNGNVAFLLSSTGEDVYLFSGTNGQLTGYSHGFTYSAVFNGVALGRYVNSVGEEFFPLELSRTFGTVNSGPRIGPIVINEINYNPDLAGDEFVELFNTSSNAVPLYDPLFPTNTWKIGGIGFTFPTNITLGAAQTLLVVATNPVTFRAKYGVSNSVQIFGPYSGNLQNDGENVTLDQPDSPNTNLVPYVTVEAVRYNDKSPWPPGADGSGLSLQRLSAFAFGNDPVNWTAAAPTPGRLADAADSDGDGLPDWWELANGTNWRLADAGADPDQDGLTNGQEYLAGTNPFDAGSNFKLSAVPGAGAVTLQFLAVANRTYSILYKDTPDSPNWLRLVDVPAQATNRVESINDPTDGQDSRLYRLVTPQWP